MHIHDILWYNLSYNFSAVQVAYIDCLSHYCSELLHLLERGLEKSKLMMKNLDSEVDCWELDKVRLLDVTRFDIVSLIKDTAPDY